MKCLRCGCDTRVLNTVSDGRKVYRNRKCKKCGCDFFTTEDVSDCKYKLLSLRDKQRKQREKQKRNCQNKKGE